MLDKKDKEFLEAASVSPSQLDKFFLSDIDRLDYSIRRIANILSSHLGNDNEKV